MVQLFEDFKPNKRYTPYLMLSKILITLILYICCTFWIPLIFIESNPFIFQVLWIIIAVIAVVLIVWVIIWAVLYYKTVVYQLNATEMIWRRGVLFRKTGIVPYNRITNIDIVQGPLMRIFGVYHLKIDTASGSGKDKSEIRIEGMENPEPIRAMIMDFVRGKAPAAAAVGSEYGTSESPATYAAAADVAELVAEVKAIRKILEKK